MRDNSNDSLILEGSRRANTKFFGLDINLPVFVISSGLAIIFSILVLVYPETSYKFLTNTMNLSLIHISEPTRPY